MRRIQAMIAAATLVPLLFLSACAGLSARENAAMPAMGKLWGTVESGIHADVLKGAPQLSAKADEMAAALKTIDFPRIVRIDWPELRDAAELGIQVRITEGQIGPGVAGSYRERLVRFTSLFQLLSTRQP